MCLGAAGVWSGTVWLASEEPLVLPDETRYLYEDRVYVTGDSGIVFRDDFNPINAWNAGVGLELRKKLHARFGRAFCIMLVRIVLLGR